MCQLLAVDGLVSMCRVCAQRQAALLNLFSMWLGLAIAASPPRTPLSEMHLFCGISDACAVGAMWWHSLQNSMMISTRGYLVAWPSFLPRLLCSASHTCTIRADENGPEAKLKRSPRE